VDRIYTVKGRPSHNPLIAHVASIDQARELAASWPAAATTLAEHFWPGPLTMVLPRATTAPPWASHATNTIAIRMPQAETLRAIIAEVGPIAAPSANRSGELSPTTASHVVASLGDRIDMILDGGPCPGGLESTVVDLTTTPPRLLRPGLITQAAIEVALGSPLSVSDDVPLTQQLSSPGMLSKHYSPRTALEVAPSVEEVDFLVNLYETAGLRVARYQAPTDPSLAAQQFYSTFHDLDAAGYDRIIAEMPPDTPAWQALRDRLQRASAEE
jgi:L-threonylcarbamoyladenylate synthase